MLQIKLKSFSSIQQAFLAFQRWILMLRIPVWSTPPLHELVCLPYWLMYQACFKAHTFFPCSLAQSMVAAVWHVPPGPRPFRWQHQWSKMVSFPSESGPGLDSLPVCPPNSVFLSYILSDGSVGCGHATFLGSPSSLCPVRKLPL